MRWRTFLWRREEERVRVGAEGRVVVFSGVVRERVGEEEGEEEDIVVAIEGYVLGLVVLLVVMGALFVVCSSSQLVVVR